MKILRSSGNEYFYDQMGGRQFFYGGQKKVTGVMPMIAHKKAKERAVGGGRRKERHIPE